MEEVLAITVLGLSDGDFQSKAPLFRFSSHVIFFLHIVE
jgi:hypothetical protein